MTPLRERGCSKENPIDLDLDPSHSDAISFKLPNSSDLFPKDNKESIFLDWNNWLRKHGYSQETQGAVSSVSTHRPDNVENIATKRLNSAGTSDKTRYGGGSGPVRSIPSSILNGAGTVRATAKTENFRFNEDPEERLSQDPERSSFPRNDSARESGSLRPINNNGLARKKHQARLSIDGDLFSHSRRDEPGKRSSYILTPTAASPTPSSATSASAGQKCRMCRQLPKKSDPLVPCSSCYYSYHKLCEEITTEELKRQNIWRCSQCRNKKRKTDHREAISASSMMPPQKKAKNGNGHREYHSTKEVSHSSASVRRKDDVERNPGYNRSKSLGGYQLSSASSVNRPLGSLVAPPVEGIAPSSKRRLPWNNSSASSPSTKSQIPEILHVKLEKRNTQDRFVPAVGKISFASRNNESSPHRISTEQRQLGSTDHDPTVPSGGLIDDTSLSSKPGAPEPTSRTANETSPSSDALKKPGSIVSESTSEVGRLSVDPSLRLVSSAALATSIASRDVDNVSSSTQTRGMVIPVLRYALIKNGKGDSVIDPVVSGTNHGPEASPRHEASDNNTAGHKRDLPKSPVAELITAPEPRVPLTRQIEPWLDEITRETSPLVEANPLEEETPSIRAETPLPSPKSNNDQERSDESMSMDTSSSRKGDADETPSKPTEAVDLQFRVGGITDVLSQAHDSSKIDSVRLDGDGTDKESSPPYSPPPAEEYRPPTRRPCHSFGCSGKGEVFIEHLWCRSHAQEYRKGKPAPSAQAVVDAPLGILSPLFGDSESTSSPTLSASMDKGIFVSIDSCEPLSRKSQKSVRIRSEKGMRALSDNSPTKSQKELEKENSDQKQALQRHAKRVSELERDLKQCYSNLSSTTQNLENAEQGILEARQKNNRLIKDNKRLELEASQLRQKVKDQEAGLDKKEARSLSREQSDEELRRQLEALQIKQQRYEAEACQLRAENLNLKNKVNASSGSGQIDRDAFDILDPLSGIDYLHDSDVTSPLHPPRKSCGRKEEFYTFKHQNIDALQFHRDNERRSRGAYGTVTAVRTRSGEADESADGQSCSDSVDSDFGSGAAVADGRRNLKWEMTSFEDFIGLSVDSMLPKVRDAKTLVFQLATTNIKSSNARQRQDRRAKFYRVGRFVPGELRK